MVGDERTGSRTTGDGLQDGCLHLHISLGVEIFAHGVEHLAAFQEDVLHSVIHHQVHIALTVTELGVFEFVISHPVLVLHDGKRLDALRQDGQLLCMHADFAHLGTEHEALDTDEVAQVEQTFEDSSI